MKIEEKMLTALNIVLIFFNFSLAIFTLFISYEVSLVFGLRTTILLLLIFGIGLFLLVKDKILWK